MSCGTCIRRKYSYNIALQDMRLLVTDNSYVPQAKHHHVHRARMATRNWLFPHIRGTHAQNVAVSALYFNDIILVVFHDYCLYLSLQVNTVLCSDFYVDFIVDNFIPLLCLFIYIFLFLYFRTTLEILLS